MSGLCQDMGHQTYPFNSAEKALKEMGEIEPQLVIVDLRMEDVGGFDVLKRCREEHRQAAVVMITAFASVETAVEAMKMGAYDYVTKPFKVDELMLTIQRALDYQAALRENVYLKQELKERYRFENIIGNSGRMQDIYSLIGKVAKTDSTILIMGESGTGKELVARALHFNSPRQHHSFVAVNCSALPENLLESELFGHKKGAFTGAVQDKAGLFEEAHMGTIFLDEINSMAQALQTKLLRVLQEREIRRVGDNRPIPVNARVVAATNEPLHEKMAEGTFREDLYYRLAVIPIQMPPLRDRKEDIPLLVNHFLQKNTPKDEALVKIEKNVIQALSAYQWPGNVRELENAIERACALCEGGVITVHDLPPHVIEQTDSGRGNEGLRLPVGVSLQDFVRDQEKLFIQATLKETGGSREKAASMLGISLATLYRKMEAKKPAAKKHVV